MLFPIVGGGPGDHFGAAIPFACRFNDDDSAYLARTPSASNRDTWSFSTWVKLGNIPTNDNHIFSAGADGSNFAALRFISGGRLQYRQRDAGSTTDDLITTQVFRDPSTWYHVLLAVDTTDGTEANRIRIYTNGNEITVWDGANYLAQNVDTDINSATTHRIDAGAIATSFLDGYLAETISVDGQALGPDDFGFVHPITGQWVPKTYIGSFETNGFRLDYANASDLGNDVSGNNNDWTSSGLATNDQVPDTPTNNYCVLNSVAIGSSGVLANGNLDLSTTTNPSDSVGATIGLPSSGKWYWEATVNRNASSWNQGFGIVGPDFEFTEIANLQDFAGEKVTWNWNSGAANAMEDDAGSITNTLTIPADTDVLQIAYDADAGDFWFGRNNTWNNSGNPSTGTTPTATGVPGGLIPTGQSVMTTGTIAGLNFDFGQHGFTYTPPTGFKALTARSLPDPVILRGDDCFAANARSGTGASGSVSGLRFQPDLVWNKSRDEGSGSYTGDHKLWDAVRGVTKSLESNRADNEATQGTGLTAFNTDGFDFGALDQINFNGDLFIDWCWKQGALPGFDIVAYVGDAVAGRTVAHSLGVPPEMMIVKNLDSGSPRDWAVYHSAMTSAPETDYMKLNLSDVASDSVERWNDTAPTSSDFSVGISGPTNENTKNHVAYLWAGVEGFSKFGGYTGNANADGPFVWCGFRPAFVLVKRASGSAGTWLIFDSTIEPNNEGTRLLQPDLTSAEATNNPRDLLSNGFKIRATNNNFNASGESYIFAAFAEAPFKYARAR